MRFYNIERSHRFVGKTLVEIKEVDKTYYVKGFSGKILGEIKALEKLNLEVERGDLITIMGPSGAGKSTLLNILGTLDRSDSGTLILDNQNIDTLNNNQLAHLRNSLLGFVFQFHHLLPEFTAFENVLLPNQIAGKKDNICQIYSR